MTDEVGEKKRVMKVLCSVKEVRSLRGPVGCWRLSLLSEIAMLQPLASTRVRKPLTEVIIIYLTVLE